MLEAVRTNNSFLPVDHLWSYNFTGGLSEFVDVDHVMLNDVYNAVARYIMLRHNFYLTNAGTYNQFLAELRQKAEAWDIPAGYLEFYCDALFRSLRVALAQLPHQLTFAECIKNPRGDVSGVVVGIRLH